MDYTGVGIPFASVVGYDSLYQLLDFSISDEEGYFNVGLPCGQSVIFVVNHLNYKADTFLLRINGHNLNPSFELEQSQLLLDEVAVTETLPISIEGDTTTYIIPVFTKGNEETLEDVLKRLPGLEINENGDIYHQGKKIDNIMVEGKPFFGNNTKMASKNIPADALGKVQLLDNFSDNPLNWENTRKKALNIILAADKKNIVFGNTLVGGGLCKKYQLQEKGFYFSKQFDASLVADVNNINEPLFTIKDYLELFGGLGPLLENSGDEVQFSLNDLNPTGFSPELVNEIPSRINPNQSDKILHLYHK